MCVCVCVCERERERERHRGREREMHLHFLEMRDEKIVSSSEKSSDFHGTTWKTCYFFPVIEGMPLQKKKVQEVS